MPKIVERLKRQLASKGVKGAKSKAIGLLKKNGILKSDGTLTAKGKKRNSMSPGQRAKSRAAKQSKGRKSSDYKYNKKNNRATLKKRKRRRS